MPTDATDGPARTKAGAAFEPKTFASGRFVVQRLLGEGGQKTVYLARDTQLNRDVAIAAIKTHGLEEASVARVRREAQTLAGLGAQPHIVTMYDIGQEQGEARRAQWTLSVPGVDRSVPSCSGPRSVGDQVPA